MTFLTEDELRISRKETRRARRRAITIFSPDGKLFQIDYARVARRLCQSLLRLSELCAKRARARARFVRRSFEAVKKGAATVGVRGGARTAPKLGARRGRATPTLRGSQVRHSQLLNPQVRGDTCVVLGVERKAVAKLQDARTIRKASLRAAPPIFLKPYNALRSGSSKKREKRRPFDVFATKKTRPRS